MTDIDSTFDHPDSASGMALSPHGAVRRERMLGELTRDMRQVHQVRRRRRNVAIVAAPLLLTIVVGLLLRNLGTSPNHPGSGPIVKGPDLLAPAPPIELVSPAAVITIVRTTAPTPDQLIARSDGAIVQALSDSELLDTLAALHRPAGLVRAGDRTWLTRSVADL